MNKLTMCLVDFAVLAVLYFLVFLPKWKHLPRIRLVLNTIFYLYLCMVLYETLMPVLCSLPNIFHHTYQPMNMSPFIDIVENHANATQDVILNVIMMIPLGFFYPLLFNEKFSKTIAITFLLSLCIELIQPLLSSYRVADISDVITNTLGGLIGCLIYYPFREKLQAHLQSHGNTDH